MLSVHDECEDSFAVNQSGVSLSVINKRVQAGSLNGPPGNALKALTLVLKFPLLFLGFHLR